MEAFKTGIYLLFTMFVIIIFDAKFGRSGTSVKYVSHKYICFPPVCSYTPVH